MKVVTLEGLDYFLSKLREIFVGKEDGQGLSENDFTDEDKAKLDSVQENAEVNVIDEIRVNGSTVNPDAKVVNINLDEYIDTLSSAEVDTIIATIN